MGKDGREGGGLTELRDSRTNCQHRACTVRARDYVGFGGERIFAFRDD